MKKKDKINNNNKKTLKHEKKNSTLGAFWIHLARSRTWRETRRCSSINYENSEIFRHLFRLVDTPTRPQSDEYLFIYLLCISKDAYVRFGSTLELSSLLFYILLRGRNRNEITDTFPNLHCRDDPLIRAESIWLKRIVCLLRTLFSYFFFLVIALFSHLNAGFKLHVRLLAFFFCLLSHPLAPELKANFRITSPLWIQRSSRGWWGGGVNDDANVCARASTCARVGTKRRSRPCGG